jgi:hypothetical protein
MSVSQHFSQTNLTVHMSREFDCWRGLEFSEKYTCVVEVFAAGRIRLELDIITFSVSPLVAGELANHLKDALAFTQGEGDQQHVQGRPQGLLTASYLTGVRGLQYTAQGEIPVTHASPDFFEDLDQGNTSISVCTIPGGGYELVFEFMCYSFTAHDAIWLSDSLLKACEQTEVLKPETNGSHIKLPT